MDIVNKSEIFSQKFGMNSRIFNVLELEGLETFPQKELLKFCGVVDELPPVREIFERLGIFGNPKWTQGERYNCIPEYAELLFQNYFLYVPDASVILMFVSKYEPDKKFKW